MEKFNKYADNKAKKVPMRFYSDIYDSNIVDDVKAEHAPDSNNNCAVYYRIVLIASINSRLDEGERNQLMDVINEINDIVQKQPQVQNQPLKVSIVVTPDLVLEKEIDIDVISTIDYYWRDEVFGSLKQASGTYVEFSFEETFNYRDATPNRWTNFCATVFPESDIDVVELPTLEERKKMFSEAIAAIQIACEKAFDTQQDKDACIEQTLQLSKEIHDIYFANDGNNFFQNMLDNVPKTVANITNQVAPIIKDVADAAGNAVDHVVAPLGEVGKFLKKTAKVLIPETTAEAVGAATAAIAGLYFLPFTPVMLPLSVLGKHLIGKPIDYAPEIWNNTCDYFSKCFVDRQKERAEKDADFRKKSEDEKVRILQVESLVSNGFTLALVYDGQGYSEDTILETIEQVLQPLEVVYIYTKDDVKPCLDVVQSRWEMRCIKNK